MDLLPVALFWQRNNDQAAPLIRPDEKRGTFTRLGGHLMKGAEGAHHDR